MKPLVIITGEAWFWQIGKIRKALSEGLGHLGRYDYSFGNNGLVKAEIKIFKIKPFIWRKLMAHEMEHHRITESSATFEEAVKNNRKFDEDTKHGLCSLAVWWGEDYE